MATKKKSKKATKKAVRSKPSSSKTKKKKTQKKASPRKTSSKKTGSKKIRARKTSFVASSSRSSEREEYGDFQGASRVEEADSESVDELLDEGNSFEAGIVEGVEDADNADEKAVHTREVPEDDVPEEYLDND